jgi:hypothetical protein
MPKVSRASASQVELVEGILAARSKELDGYTVAFESYMADMDPAPVSSKGFLMIDASVRTGDM